VHVLAFVVGKLARNARDERPGTARRGDQRVGSDSRSLALLWDIQVKPALAPSTSRCRPGLEERRIGSSALVRKSAPIRVLSITPGMFG
jgi:hypothetical protein